MTENERADPWLLGRLGGHGDQKEDCQRRDRCGDLLRLRELARKGHRVSFIDP
jgi:hypothetical protein